MTILIAGLIIFLGIHSIRIFAEPLRTSLVDRLGANGFKGVYTLLSLVGFGLIIWGYSQTRIAAVDLWYPPMGLRHATTVLTLISFVLIAASSISGSHIKALVGHPMTVGVMVWAFAHLLSNGRLGDVVLFGSFTVWSILTYRAAKRRDRLNETPKAVATGWSQDLITVIAGVIAWTVFAMLLHGWLIGVRPFG